MLLDSAENKCILMVLELLNQRPYRYSELFKKTKVSHTTLQKVLGDLINKNFIENIEGNYSQKDNGLKLLRLIKQIKELF